MTLMSNRPGVRPALLRFAASHVDDDPGRVATRIDNMSLHLQDDGWEPVMLIRDRLSR